MNAEKTQRGREMTHERQNHNPHAVITVKCAVCGRVRQETNHWFTVRTVCFFVCWPFSEEEELQQDERPVCGQGCAQKEFESWMTGNRNLEATQAGHAT